MSNVKNIYLTSRDHDLFLDLYDLTFLDMDYLQKVIYLNDGRQIAKNTIDKRIAKLEKHGFITSFRLPIIDKATPAGRSKKVYVLDSKGLEEVRALIGEVKWDKRWTNRTLSHVSHSLEGASIKAAFKSKETKSITVSDWLDEKRGYFKSEQGNVIRPDAMLILHLREHQRHIGYFIEVERSRQRKEVNVNKLERYNRYCYQRSYEEHLDMDIPIPRIIFASNKETEMKKLIEHTSDVDTSSTSGVLYTTLEQIKKDPYGKIFFAKDSANPNQIYHLLESIKK